MSRDIIAAIDGAVHDWEVSADAMRWSPDKADRDPEPGEFLTVDITPDFRRWTYVSPRRTMSMPVRFTQADVELLREIFRPAIDQVNAAFRQLARALRPMTRDRYTLWPPAQDEPEDVRARALRLRQTRNTGPAKPPPGQRPPRTITSINRNSRTMRYTPVCPHASHSARPKTGRAR